MDYPYKLYSYDDLKADLVRIKLIPQKQALHYRAGQYLELHYPNQSWNPFSIANAPNENGLIELHIRHNSSDLAIYDMLNNLKTTKTINVRGPWGNAYFRQEGSFPVLFIAGGTGFAYCKALIEEAVNKKDARALHLYWGVKAPQDFYLPELLTTWPTQLPQFKYTLIISRHGEHEEWQGETGYVQTKIIEDHPDLKNYRIYAGGPPNMVKSVYLALLPHGLQKSHVYSDVLQID